MFRHPCRSLQDCLVIACSASRLDEVSLHPPITLPGDYSTRGGKSMIIAMSAGYGIVFELVFVSFMIIVIFGLFNIITAIFVDSTTAGLKHNDVKRCRLRFKQQWTCASW